MNRIIPTRFALFTLAVVGLLVGSVAAVFAATNPTPTPTSAIVKARVFNDCPSSNLTVTNNYPSAIVFDDANLDCFGFANLDVWHLSADGVNEAAFDDNASYRLSMDFKIEGTGNGEGGIQVSPWWSHDADGLFNVRSTDGEIACFGGRLPFFTFTGAFGLRYHKGDTIHLGVVYEPRQLNAGNPATIEYDVDYLGTHYTSGPIAFDQGNPAEDPPHGLWGELNDARVGGHFKAFLGQGNPVETKATFSNIVFATTPSPNSAVVFERVFNDCPSSTLVTTNSYPSLISFDDSNLDCFGFANLHVWHFSENGTSSAIFNNNANFRFETDFQITGSGNGEGGILIAPWYSHFADGLFNVRSTDGEIACFGGRLPFFTFTGAFGLRYHKGDVIHLVAIYAANGRDAASPATIEYRVSYLGADYTSGVIPFDQGNPAEDPPYGLYGMLNYGAVGGHFKAFLGQGNPVAVKGTFSNIKFSHCLHPASVSVTVRPRTINTGSHGKVVTAYITADNVNDIDVSTLQLNGVPASLKPFAPTIEDGVLKVRFDRAAVAATLTSGDNSMVLTGEIGSDCIESSDVIRASAPQITSPSNGDQLIAGSITDVTWDVRAGITPLSLLSSTDGVSWTKILDGIPNTGSLLWVVPSSGSPMQVELTAVYETDETGIVNQNEYAISSPFTIAAPLSVDGGSLGFSLRVPNPVSGRLTTSFSLPSTVAAELSVFDIAGRELVKRDVGGHSGLQTASLGELPTGLYVVRLSQAGRSLSSRVAVIR